MSVIVSSRINVMQSSSPIASIQALEQRVTELCEKFVAGADTDYDYVSISVGPYDFVLKRPERKPDE